MKTHQTQFLPEQNLEHITRKLLGAIVMASFAMLAMYKFTYTGATFYLLMFLRDSIATYFISIRNKAENRSGWPMMLLAYASSGLPLLFISNQAAEPWVWGVANVLAIIGFTIAALATIELGTSMGVAPAKRGERVKSGVYRYLSHPMYTGYFICQIGWVLVDWKNIALVLFSTGFMVFRAKIENQIQGDRD